jgi:hypothetical protein
LALNPQKDAFMHTRSVFRALLLIVALSLLHVPQAHADAVTDWNARACDTVVAAQLSPLAANRAMAIVQTAVYDAVKAAGSGDHGPGPASRSPASADAAVAAANRAALSKLAPTQQAAIDRAYEAALSAIPDGAAKTRGIVLGEQAAAAVLAARAGDDAIAPESYRPLTRPGAYVPTALPVGIHWPQRKPWLMARADQFRPGPPPALSSAQWARDYNEIKALGAKTSTRRSDEQTRIARFWEAVEPAIYAQIVRSVADAPGRDLTRNARLYAIVAQGIDDALIAVFDAKHHYGFWRPITAIRNGDIDGNDATQRDAAWMPFIDTPPHPEYPCAHCIVAATVGTVLKAEVGGGATPTLRSTSSKAPGVVRTWTRIDDFVQEVSEARICDGVHYRTSSEVGTAMGAKIGALASAAYPPPW